VKLLKQSDIKQSDIEEAKRKNIIEMAVDFTGMVRVFSKGSVPLIQRKVEEFFSQLADIRTSDEFQ
jgi:hypothetical protein